LATFPGANGRIAYARGTGIQTILPDGSKNRGLARGSEPSWSADGRSMVFTRTVGGTDGPSDVFSMRANGSDVHRITHTGASESAPAYAPGGKRIVFNQISSGKSSSIISARASDGSHRDRLGVGRDPIYSPDGKQIVYSKGSKQDQGIWTMRADGSHKRQVTRPGPKRSDVKPDFSPDGRWIAFTRFTFPGDKVAEAVRTNGSGRHFLGCAEYAPTYSPNGKKIAWVHPWPEGRFSIYSATLLASGCSSDRRLTNRFNSEAPDPSWQPK
jgi:TolB protein